jgi:hypothetical protein
MLWLRRIAAAPLLLLAFIGAIGLVKAVTHRIDDPVGTAVFCAILVLITLGGTYFLHRPDIERRIRRAGAVGLLPALLPACEGRNAPGKRYVNLYHFAPCGTHLVLVNIAENPQ